MRSVWRRSIITTSAPSSASSKLAKALAPIASIPAGINAGGAHKRTSAPKACRHNRFDLATRLCRMSPQITTLSPVKSSARSPLSRKAWRSASASSSAWVGCSCCPSPALSTGQSTLSAISPVAPLDPWRMTIASARIALSVIAVSISVSPFFTLDVAACIFTTSAPSRLPAISKLSSVRVEFSKNALMMVKPDKASTCLALCRLKVTHCSASSSRNRISCRSNWPIPSRSRCGKARAPAG